MLNTLLTSVVNLHVHVTGVISGKSIYFKTTSPRNRMIRFSSVQRLPVFLCNRVAAPLHLQLFSNALSLVGRFTKRLNEYCCRRGESDRKIRIEICDSRFVFALKSVTIRSLDIALLNCTISMTYIGKFPLT